MSELHWNTVTSAMRNIMTAFTNDPLAEEFDLAYKTIAHACPTGVRQAVDHDSAKTCQASVRYN